MEKLISLERLATFWDKIKSYFQPKLDTLDRKIWMGTEEDLQDAIQKNLVDDTTTIVITGGESTPTYQFATESDIRNILL